MIRRALVPVAIVVLIATALQIRSAISEPGATLTLDTGAVSPGCEEIEHGKLVDAHQPTPVEAQFSPPRVPLDAFGVVGGPDTEVPFESMVGDRRFVGGWTLQTVVMTPRDQDGVPATIRYLFGDRPLGPGETLMSFIDAGGVAFLESEGGKNDADFALSVLEENGRDVMPPVTVVGPFKALAVHSDPTLRNDLRPWHVYWSDGTYDFAVIGDALPEDLVNFARALQCSDSAG